MKKSVIYAESVIYADQVINVCAAPHLMRVTYAGSPSTPAASRQSTAASDVTNAEQQRHV
jgi:hypothetical protein